METNVTSSYSSEEPNQRKSLAEENEEFVVNIITKNCVEWYRKVVFYNLTVIVLGVCAISTSVLVSIYTGSTGPKAIDPGTLKILACISTISLGLITAFNLVLKSNNSITAWRSLNTALLMYYAGEISIVQLIEQYQKGEKQMGAFNFNFSGKGTDDSQAKEGAQEQEPKRSPVRAPRKENKKSGLFGTKDEPAIGATAKDGMQKEKENTTQRIVTPNTPFASNSLNNTGTSEVTDKSNGLDGH